MKALYSFEETKNLIKNGDSLFISGSEKLIIQLPQGKWIAGTIPYFMGEDGGVLTEEKLHVVILPKNILESEIKFYKKDELNLIPQDYKANGFSYILIPAFSDSHISFAKNCFNYSGIFDRPLIGWISGHNLSENSNPKAKVINGSTGEISDQDAIVMHCNLPNDEFAKINIINIFNQGNGDTITFNNTGFEVTTCSINGEVKNLAEYIYEKKLDTKLPLVANYSGAMVNVSIKSVDKNAKKVYFYAPVFPNIDYKLASPIDNYEQNLKIEIEKANIKPLFSCNCILNYLYAKLEGKKTGEITGPMTFGEIAYMLLNQTIVYLTIEKK